MSPPQVDALILEGYPTDFELFFYNLAIHDSIIKNVHIEKLNDLRKSNAWGTFTSPKRDAIDAIAWEMLLKVLGRLWSNPQSGFGLGRNSDLHFVVLDADLFLVELHKDLSRNFVLESFFTAWKRNGISSYSAF